MKFFVVFFFFSAIFCAQNRVKSIENELDRFHSFTNNNLDSAFFYINKAKVESATLDHDSIKARVFSNLGYYYYLKNNFQDCRKNIDKALIHAKKVKYYKVITYCYTQYGSLASDKDKFTDALRWYLLSLKMTEEKQIWLNKSRVLISLGNLYLYQKDTIKALNYYLRNIANAEKYKFDDELSKGYMTVAEMYLGNNDKKAIDLYKKALVIVKKNKDLNNEFVILVSLSNLYMYYNSKNRLEKVYYYLQEAEKIQKVLKDESMMFYINYSYGACFYYNKQFEKALEYYNKAVALSKLNIISEKRLSLYNTISKLYVDKSDFKNALFFKEKYNSLKDSVYDIEKNKTFNEIQTKYDVDNKNLKISLLTKDKQIQQNNKRSIIIVSIILLSLLLITVLFLRQRIKTQRLISLKKQTIHKQEIIRLEQEKELKRVNGVLEGQNQERNRLAKEIHDGIGGSLAGIKLELSQVNSTLNDEKLDVIIGQMSNAFNELRSISHNLSFNFMKDKNLENLIYQLVFEYQNRNEFEIQVVIYPENALNNLSESIKHNLYRIIQELITNVSKHAGANQILLNLTKHDNSLNIIFEDDGVGLDANQKDGIGIKNIKERILILNGTIVIEGIKGKGTTVLIDIPTND